MKDSEIKNTGGMTGGQLDTLREILFGQQVVKYDNQFDELIARIEQERREIDTKAAEMHLHFTQTIQALNETLSRRLEEHRAYTQQQLDRVDDEKTNRAELGKMLIQIGQKLIEDGKA